MTRISVEDVMTPEGRVKAKVKEILKKAGAYQHWPVQNGMGSPCLDCHGCFNGYYFAIECKAPGKKMTPRQEQTATEIVKARGKVFLIASDADYVWLEGWLNYVSS
jgi:hypothetical protein